MTNTTKTDLARQAVAQIVGDAFQTADGVGFGTDNSAVIPKVGSQ